MPEDKEEQPPCQPPEDEDEPDELEWNLGFVEQPTKPHMLLRHRFPSKVGGRPAWLDPVRLPSRDMLTCRATGKPLDFLLQVYAPVDANPVEGFHRSLFLFISPEGSRLKEPGAVRLFRCQLPRLNPYYSSEPPREKDKYPQPLSVADQQASRERDPWRSVDAEQPPTPASSSGVSSSAAKKRKAAAAARAAAAAAAATSAAIAATPIPSVAPSLKGSEGGRGEAAAEGAAEAAGAGPGSTSRGSEEAQDSRQKDGLLAEASETAAATAAAAAGAAAPLPRLGMKGPGGLYPELELQVEPEDDFREEDDDTDDEDESEEEGEKAKGGKEAAAVAAAASEEAGRKGDGDGARAGGVDAEVRKALKEYRQRVATEGELDDEELPADILDAVEGAAAPEQQCFADFQARVSWAPDQVVRYCFQDGARPLWPAPHGRPGPGDIPPCACCGAPRKMELQVLPQLLHYLRLDEEDSSSPDWSCLVAYTCSKSCSPPEGTDCAYLEELVWVQAPAP